MRYRLALWALLAVGGFASAQSPAEFIRVMKAKREGAKAVKYELEVTIHQLLMSGGEGGGFTDSKRSPVTKRYTLELDLVRGWMYREVEGEEYTPLKGGGSSVNKVHACSTFHDGVFQTVQWPQHGVESAVGREPGRSSDFAEIRGDLTPQAFEFEWWPAFTNVGLMPLTTRTALYPGKFHEAGPDTDDVDLLSESPSAVGPGGRKGYECLQPKSAKSGKRLEFEVDARSPTHVLLLRKVTTGMDERIECHYTSGDLRSWEYKATVRDKLYYKSSFRVLSCRVNEAVDDAKYELKPASGMVVRKLQQSADKEQNSADTYRATPGGGLEKIDSVFDPQPKPAGGGVWWWVIGGVSGALAVGVLLLIWRKRQSSNPSGQEQA